MKTRPTKYFMSILVLNSIIFFLTFSGVVILPFIIDNDPSEIQEDMYVFVAAVFKMSAGAFIGLLGGRASVSTQ